MDEALGPAAERPLLLLGHGMGLGALLDRLLDVRRIVAADSRLRDVRTRVGREREAIGAVGTAAPGVLVLLEGVLGRQPLALGHERDVAAVGRGRLVDVGDLVSVLRLRSRRRPCG